MKMRHLFLIALIILIGVSIGNTAPRRVTSGQIAGQLIGSTTSYFQNQSLTTLTTYYQELDFGFYSTGIKLANDATNYIEWSWDGTKTAGQLLALDVDTTDNIMMDDIHIRGEVGGESFRLIVW